MTKPNAVLMQEARDALKNRWGLAIGVCLVYAAIMLVLSGIPGIGFVISLIISGPLLLGLTTFILAYSRHQPATFGDLFKGFNHFGRAAGTYLWMMLFIFLWTLLFIIPGIIAGIAYSQTFYLLAEDESLRYREAIKKSRRMMYGYKLKYFFLQCRFIGWALLSILTLGIGFLWLIPYIQVSQAKFYDDLKAASAAA